MSEKEKGKSHPFAGHLRPTEEVLWMRPYQRPSFMKQLRAVVDIAMFAPFLGGIYLLTEAINVRLPTYFYVVMIAAMIVMIILGVGMLFVSPFLPPSTFYAVTNERLLLQYWKQVVSFPLEKIAFINVVKDEQKQESLSFGPAFPMWSNIKDAEDVKSLIENAQKNRLKEIPS